MTQAHDHQGHEMSKKSHTGQHSLRCTPLTGRGAILMSLSTVIVAINTKFLKVRK